MTFSKLEIQQKILDIDLHIRPEDQRYGQLLNWQNSPDPFWHYGIGLSDHHIFDTGRGWLPFEKADANLVLGVEHLLFQPSVVIQRLKHSLHCFARWEYNLTGWNCEHLARLVATDQARCYQSQFIWFLCNLTPEGEHKTARQTLHDYLRSVNQ